MRPRNLLKQKDVPELEPRDQMKLFFIYFIILFVFACILFFNIKRSEGAFIPNMQGMYNGKWYDCKSVEYPSKGKPTCNAIIKKKITNIGDYMKVWTGIYDPKREKLYSGDPVSTPGYPYGVITWENNQYMYGYYIWIGHDTYYTFGNLEGQPKSTWSTKLSENYNKK